MCTDNLNIGINGKLNKTETILLCHMNIKYFLPPPTFFTWPFVRPSVRPFVTNLANTIFENESTDFAYTAKNSLRGMERNGQLCDHYVKGQGHSMSKLAVVSTPLGQ